MSVLSNYRFYYSFGWARILYKEFLNKGLAVKIMDGRKYFIFDGGVWAEFCEMGSPTEYCDWWSKHIVERE